MARLSKCFLTGDVREWPLDQDSACEFVRVRIVRAQKDKVKHFRELRVRSRVVKRMANIYMERHIQDLGNRPHVLKLAQVSATPSVGTPETTREQIRAHIEARVDATYPETEFGGAEGAVPQLILEMLEGDNAESPAASGFEMKQATMPDNTNVGPNMFQGMRPIIVTDEGDTRSTFSKEAVAEASLADKVNVIDFHVSKSIEKQFISHYACIVFPWALNYDCGGADYPELFAGWAWLEKNIAQREGEEAVGRLQERWRRINDEAPLLPSEYAQMLACRPEMQIAGDWMCVPAARNLQWRYAVLHSTFLVCKQKVAPGDTLHQSLDKLMDSLHNIWEKISGNAVVIDKRKIPTSGNIGLLFSDSTMGGTDKLVLRSYMNVTNTFRAAKHFANELATFSLGSAVAMGSASS